ncbi:protoporphyrinogen/coproporphyrinogen oxidase [Salinibacterium hongtaonis]|uniref:protoporphyrinogen/coproporphyrinogen oxidase n=1 Tax=Homoserinimonas hongtaonis TaxID=2079791 RepID=UPI000D375D58|nr:FAD-dependent oxidoreductase [Salinibacterium hongtaonis]AWB89200.1 protoporphyrinogen oxidase [Salinibacterium hongtaonis]
MRDDEVPDGTDPATETAPAAEHASPPVDVVVVGGGVAGLVAARELILAGLSVTLVEATGRLGGRVGSHQVAGLTLDSGAESFATRGGSVAAYVTKLGLGDDIVMPNPAGAWLQRDDHTALPLPKAGVLGIPSVPLAADVINVVGFSAALRAQLDSLLPGVIGSRATTLGELVRKRMGSRVVERLVAPVTMGVHSRHPDELPLDRVAPGLITGLKQEESLAAAVRAMRSASAAGTQVAGIRGGISRLVTALEAALERFGVTVLLSTPVDSIDDEGVVLSDGRRIDARHVVLAAPDAHLTNRAPAAAVATAEDIVLATLVVRSAALDASPRGTGVLVARAATAVTAKALTHATAKWAWLAESARDAAGHRHVLRLSYSAARLRDAPTSDLRETARGDAARLLGVPITREQVLGFARVEWPGVVPEERPAPAGITTIGESVAGTGLAAVIAQARSASAQVIEDFHSQPTAGDD